MKTLIFGAFAALCFAPTALASQIMYTTVYDSQVSNAPHQSNFTVFIPKFSPSLGILTAFEISMEVNWAIDFHWDFTEFTNGEAYIDRIFQTNESWVKKSDNNGFGQFLVNIDYHAFSIYYGTKGEYHQRNNEIYPLVTFDNEPLESLTGYGTLDVYNELENYYYLEDLGIGPNGVYHVIFDNDYQYFTINTKYTYRPYGAIPEPDIWFFLTTGFGMVGAAMRTRRSLFATEDSTRDLPRIKFAFSSQSTT